MGDDVRELLSRFMDGDLGPADEEALRERLAGDPELVAELDAMRAVQRSVRKLAESMEPPVALDPVIEPLLNGPPAPPRRVRPFYRWLGAAAAIVLGVTVVMEVVRRNPAPSTVIDRSERPRRSPSEDQVFELAPLPTAVPDENRPLGAVDRLMDEEPTSPKAPEIAPLEVIGPTSTDLEAERSATVGGREKSKVSDEPDSDAPDEEIDDKPLRGSVAEAPAATDSATTAAGHDASDAGSQISGVSAGSRARDDLRQPAPAKSQRLRTAAQARLEIGVAEVWSGVAGSCTTGIWGVRLVIRDGVIISVDLIDEEHAQHERLVCPRDTLLGAVVVGVGDGEHLGELVVGSPTP